MSATANSETMASRSKSTAAKGSARRTWHCDPMPSFNGGSGLMGVKERLVPRSSQGRLGWSKNSGTAAELPVVFLRHRPSVRANCTIPMLRPRSTEVTSATTLRHSCEPTARAFCIHRLRESPPRTNAVNSGVPGLPGHRRESPFLERGTTRSFSEIDTARRQEPPSAAIFRSIRSSSEACTIP